MSSGASMSKDIERLIMENEQLRKALERIGNDKTYCLGGTFAKCQEIALEALNG